MPAKSNIINVRLAPMLKQRLEEHRRAGALSSSDVIRLALNHPGFAGGLNS
jgi:hypothetical protein